MKNTYREYQRQGIQGFYGKRCQIKTILERWWRDQYHTELAITNVHLNDVEKNHMLRANERNPKGKESLFKSVRLKVYDDLKHFR